MLNLERKIGQSVLIGENITVVVRSITKLKDGSLSVKLGFDAPQSITIDRPEIRKQRLENIDKLFNRK